MFQKADGLPNILHADWMHDMYGISQANLGLVMFFYALICAGLLDSKLSYCFDTSTKSGQNYP